MSRFFREAAPPPPHPGAVRLAQLTAAHDQAVAYIERALVANRGNTAVTDVLLDLRLLLRPPERPTP
ncbi:hypothetical protein M3G91_23515 [Micromonospora chalcea]|uniref:hypothetical protein n=1 Tax=Micromonospora chalcea TaxID=1874 RepID=UPI0021A96732|nr:hypothetical protein [Micromonospora chalcea]MCT2280588.1 hypothetical protein [Micromonospora chalcea]